MSLDNRGQCKNCAASRMRQRGNGNMLECHGEQPRLYPMPQMPSAQNPQGGMMYQALWPPVEPDEW